MEPILSQLLADMNSDQVKHLKEHLAEENQENRKKFLEDPKAYEKEKIERNLEAFEDWCGSLSDEQELEVTSMSKEVTFPIQLWLDKREKQQGILLDLVQAKPGSVDSIQKFINGYITRKSTDITKDYNKASKEFRQNLNLRFLKLMSGLSKEQRRHLMDRLKDYEKQIRDIASG